MRKKFIESLEKLNFRKHSKIILCISGGKDSICMLDLFYSVREEFDLELITVHFNHSLREESDRDEKFVYDITKKYRLKHYSIKDDVNKFANKEKIGVEEAARILRYRYFEKIKKMESADYISTAHNKNDNAETIIMRILRGTGINGLCGIPKKTEDIIRPLLDFDVEEIVSYVNSNSLDIVEDHTNNLDIYSRNKIRLNLIPQLEREYNPNLINSLDKLSEISKNYVEFVRDYIKSKEDELYFFEEGKIKVDIGEIKEEKNYFRNIFFREIYEMISGSSDGISFDFIEKINGLLECSTGKYITIKNVIFKIKYNFLYVYIDEKKGEKSSKFYFENLNFSLYNTEFFDIIIERTDVVDFSKNKNSKSILFLNEKYLQDLKIRNRKNGDYINFSFGRKKLKDIFIDEKVDVELRNEIPIFEINDDIVWISNIKRSDKYLVDIKEKILKVTVTRRNNEVFK